MTTRPAPDVTRLGRGARVLSYRSLRSRAAQGQPLFLYGPLPTTSPKPTGDWPLSGPTKNGEVLVLYYDTDRRAFRVYNSAQGITWGQLGRAWVSASDMSALISTRPATAHLALPRNDEPSQETE